MPLLRLAPSSPRMLQNEALLPVARPGKLGLVVWTWRIKSDTTVFLPDASFMLEDRLPAERFAYC